MDWIDSGACATLIKVWKAMRLRGQPLVLCVTDPVRETFRITGLVRLMPTFTELDPAVEAARAARQRVAGVTARPPAFPPDYATARDRFRAAAARLGWRQARHAIPGTGPNGEGLTIDAAVSPHPDASKVLVVSSGLHGAEGPFGSAVQLAVMDRFAAGPPPAGVRYVFLHALNPWGYADGRRADADNVDPNRNFLLPGEEYRGSADGYRYFDALLNPRSPPGRFDLFVPRAWLAVARFGVPALRQALAGGQYDYPKGVFFGGHRPTATHLAMRSTRRLARPGGRRRPPRLPHRAGAVGHVQAPPRLAGERLPAGADGPLVRPGHPRGRRPAQDVVPAAGRFRAVVRGPAVRPGVPLRRGRVRDARQHPDAGRAAGREPGGPLGEARRAEYRAGEEAVAQSCSSRRTRRGGSEYWGRESSW